tara:strand:- start:3 stop:338 length:336 start_codon:yes stop_codon:yes gene_type:complete
MENKTKFNIHNFDGENLNDLVGEGHNKLYPPEENVIARKSVEYKCGMVEYKDQHTEVEARMSDCGRYVEIIQCHPHSCIASNITLTTDDLKNILKASYLAQKQIRTKKGVA